MTFGGSKMPMRQPGEGLPCSRSAACSFLLSIGKMQMIFLKYTEINNPRRSRGLFILRSFLGKALLSIAGSDFGGAVGQYLPDLMPSQKHRQPAHRHGDQAADCHAKPVIQHLPKGANGQ